MKASKALYQFLRDTESLCRTTRACDHVGLTVGYGHTGYGVSPGLEVTEKQAELYLRADVESAEMAVNVMVDRIMNQHQFDAFVSFVYNVGSGNFRKSTLLQKFNSGDEAGAALEFSRWVKGPGGHVLPGLVLRRQKEKKMFLQ